MAAAAAAAVRGGGKAKGGSGGSLLEVRQGQRKAAPFPPHPSHLHKRQQTPTPPLSLALAPCLGESGDQCVELAAGQHPLAELMQGGVRPLPWGQVEADALAHLPDTESKGRGQEARVSGQGGRGERAEQ